MSAEPREVPHRALPQNDLRHTQRQRILSANKWVRLITRRHADRGDDCGLAVKLHIAFGWTGVEQRVDDGYRVFDYSLSALQFVGCGNAYTD